MGAPPKPNALACEHCPSKDKSIFCDLHSEKLDDVSNHKIVNTYKKGQTLFVQGNPAFGLFCINKGNIKLSKIGPDGKESIVKLAQAGNILGHRSLFTQTAYTATATALEDAVVCFFEKKFINELMNRGPEVSMRVIQQLSNALGTAEDRVASLSQKSVPERLAELLLLLKESHGVKAPGEKICLEIKLTREEMASLIGTAPETLIRFISEMKENGILDQNGKTLYIINEQALIKQAGPGY